MTEAVTVDEYGQSLIPDVLRTRDYDRALLVRSIDVDPDSIDDRLDQAATARDLVTNGPSAARRRYTVVVSEQVLHCPVGSPEVMAEQLNLLLSLSVRSGISVRVIPQTVGAHAGLRGSFSVAACPDITAACTADELNLHLLDHPDAVTHYAGIFNALTATALTPEESRTLIGRVAIQVYGSKLLPIERPVRLVKKAAKKVTAAKVASV